MTDLKGKTVLTVLRHEKSLGVVRAFVEERGGKTVDVALDVIELPDRVPAALDAIREAVPRAHAIVAGTKIYDPVKDGPSHMGDFLAVLKDAGVGVKPVVLTHLQDVAPGLKQVFEASGLNISYVENDNLGRNGMEKLGPALMAALEYSRLK